METTVKIKLSKKNPQIILKRLIYSLIVSLVFQWLFNTCVAELYNITEMSYKLAFVIMTPLIFLYLKLNTIITTNTNYKKHMMYEATSSRMYLYYILEYMVLTKSMEPIDTNPIDNEEKL